MRSRIDDRGRVRIAVERKHTVRIGIVDDRVGIFGCRNPGEFLKGLEIEHHYRLNRRLREQRQCDRED